jgi:hypothetical protein
MLLAIVRSSRGEDSLDGEAQCFQQIIEPTVDLSLFVCSNATPATVLRNSVHRLRSGRVPPSRKQIDEAPIRRLTRSRFSS